MAVMLPPAVRYAAWLAVLRIYTGLFWLSHGIPKVLAGQGFYGSSGFLVGILTQAARQGSGPYNAFLVHVVLPHAALFGYLVAWGETLTGICLTLGLLTPVGAAVGAFLALNYFLMKGSYGQITSVGGLDAAAIVLSLVNLVLPTGLVWGLDGRLRTRTPGAAAAARAGEMRGPGE
jgi:uncharacterized membrane protein YphA (DoxX/SURF4 family)